MPTTPSSIVIAVKSSTTAYDGEYVKVTNLTSGGTITGQFKDSECILNPANSNLTWSNGDLLNIEVKGRLIGSTQTRISKGGVDVTVTTSADTNSPAINL